MTAGGPPALDLRRALRRGLVVLVLTLGVVVVIALALLEADPRGRDLAAILERTDPLGLVAAILLISLSTACVALRWRALVPDRQGSPVVLTGFLCVGLLFNYALPGPVGEVVAAVMLRRRHGVPLADGLASLAVSRVVGLATASALAGLLYVAFPVPVPPTWAPLLGAAAWVLLLGGGALLAGALWPGVPRRLAVPLLAPLGRLPGRLGRLGAGVRTAAIALLDALVRTAGRGAGAYAEATVWAMVGHLVVATGITLAAWSLGLAPAWTGVVFTYAAATAGAVLLFLFPGSHVGWDMSFAALFSVSADVPVAEAAALTVVVRLQQSFVVLLGVAALWLLARDLLPAGREVDEALSRP